VKKIFILILAAALCFACSREVGQITCTLAVYSDEAAIIEKKTVELKKGKSVLDILKDATRSAKIHMDYSGAGLAAYVKGIDNLYEFDKGPESGWVFSVNGAVAQKSAGSFVPEDGDEIVWEYVLETPPITR